MTEDGDRPIYTRLHWAKFEDGRIHLLEHHLADVGACFEALMAQPTIRRRLARSGGLDDLDEATVARLSLFAALHDIGKVNVGFQTRAWRDADLPEDRRKPGRAGHYNELAPVLTDGDRQTAAWFFKALGWWNEATASWDDRCGETVCALFVATLSHHGTPLQLEGGRPPNPILWQPYGGLDPRECVERIGRLARDWFPAAFSGGGRKLPSAPAFQHTFLGLCNWADWIGSDERRWFKYEDQPRDDYIHTARARAKQAVSDLGLDVSSQRESLGTPPDFGGLFDIAGSPEANAIQQAAIDAPLEEPLVIIESETGSGKTEAALWRFAKMYADGLVDGLYFALPTRAAAVQIHGRVARFARNLFPDGAPPVVLAVPGYDPGEDAARVGLPRYNDEASGHEHGDIPWASENPKRYLAAQIAVGTVDQAMMGALKVKNAHLRAACLSRNLLVVDEVHASDAYMSRILRSLLAAHLGAGGHALLMSATLGSSARRSWMAWGRLDTADVQPLEEAKAVPYPAVTTRGEDGERVTDVAENGQQKTVDVTAPEAAYARL